MIMSNIKKFPAGEVASRLIERLRANNKKDQIIGKKRNVQEKKKNGEKIKGKKYNEEKLAECVELLEHLISEKEDLERQIVSDDNLFDGKKAFVEQDEVIKILDVLKEGKVVDIRNLVASIGAHQGIESSRREAVRALASVKQEIRNMLEESEIRGRYREKLVKRIETAREARAVINLEKLQRKIALARMELLARRNGESSALTVADRGILDKYTAMEDSISKAHETFMSRGEVYYEAKRRNLLECRRQLLNSGFVETAGVRRDIIAIISHLRLGIPVLLRGHLGAGKTEMALYVARKYFRCEPEFISGSEEATKYDIYGKTQIGVRPEEQKTKEFRQRMDEYLHMNPETTKEELKKVEKEYYETIVVKGLTTSFFQYGPLVRAMKEGKPIVIDEMDGIPHSIIMRLNHVLTRRPGDTVQVQENSGGDIVVRKGFCVIATGNIKSARYKREELDAAFLSRWWSLDVEYPTQEETYEILVSSLVDRRGNLQIKGQSDLDSIKRLTETAAEIQSIFSGEHLDYLGEGGDAVREIPASLKKTVLSLRHLWNIVRPWKANNFDKPIETYILNEFIRPAVAEDRIYLVQLCCRFRFFKEWKAYEFGIPGLTEAKLLAFQGKQKLGEG